MMTSVTLSNEAERVTSNPNKKLTPTPTAAVLPKPMTGHFSVNGREGCARAHTCAPD
jgi:predicted aspartyl protease